jgi:hypothetical protein
MLMTGKLKAEVEKIGGYISGVGAHRAISLCLENNQRVWAYPIVGIPTAEILNDISEKASQANQKGIPILIYDHIGIQDAWVRHLKWLEDHIKIVRSIKISEAGWDLAALEE